MSEITTHRDKSDGSNRSNSDNNSNSINCHEPMTDKSDTVDVLNVLKNIERGLSKYFSNPESNKTEKMEMDSNTTDHCKTDSLKLQRDSWKCDILPSNQSDASKSTEQSASTNVLLDTVDISDDEEADTEPYTEPISDDDLAQQNLRDATEPVSDVEEAKTSTHQPLNPVSTVSDVCLGTNVIGTASTKLLSENVSGKKSGENSDCVYVWPVNPDDLSHNKLRPIIMRTVSVNARFFGLKCHKKQGCLELKFASDSEAIKASEELKCLNLYDRPWNVIVSAEASDATVPMDNILNECGKSLFKCTNVGKSQMTRVLVQNLPEKVPEHLLQIVFPFSSNIYVPLNSEGTNKGYAVVYFSSWAEAWISVEKVNGITLGNKQLKMRCCRDNHDLETAIFSYQNVSKDEMRKSPHDKRRERSKGDEPPSKKLQGQRKERQDKDSELPHIKEERSKSKTSSSIHTRVGPHKSSHKPSRDKVALSDEMICRRYGINKCKVLLTKCEKVNNRSDTGGTDSSLAGKSSKKVASKALDVKMEKNSKVMGEYKKDVVEGGHSKGHSNKKGKPTAKIDSTANLKNDGAKKIANRKRNSSASEKNVPESNVRLSIEDADGPSKKYKKEVPVCEKSEYKHTKSSEVKPVQDIAISTVKKAELSKTDSLPSKESVQIMVELADIVTDNSGGISDKEKVSDLSEGNDAGERKKTANKKITDYRADTGMATDKVSEDEYVGKDNNSKSTMLEAVAVKKQVCKKRNKVKKTMSTVSSHGADSEEKTVVPAVSVLVTPDKVQTKEDTFIAVSEITSVKADVEKDEVCEGPLLSEVDTVKKQVCKKRNKVKKTVSTASSLGADSEQETVVPDEVQIKEDIAVSDITSVKADVEKDEVCEGPLLSAVDTVKKQVSKEMKVATGVVIIKEKEDIAVDEITSVVKDNITSNDTACEGDGRTPIMSEVVTVKKQVCKKRKLSKKIRPTPKGIEAGTENKMEVRETVVSSSDIAVQKKIQFTIDLVRKDNSTMDILSQMAVIQECEPSIVSKKTASTSKDVETVTEQKMEKTETSEHSLDKADVIKDNITTSTAVCEDASTMPVLCEVVVRPEYSHVSEKTASKSIQIELNVKMKRGKTETSGPSLHKEDVIADLPTMSKIVCEDDSSMPTLSEVAVKKQVCKRSKVTKKAALLSKMFVTSSKQTMEEIKTGHCVDEVGVSKNMQNVSEIEIGDESKMSPLSETAIVKTRGRKKSATVQKQESRKRNAARKTVSSSVTREDASDTVLDAEKPVNVTSGSVTDMSESGDHSESPSLSKKHKGMSKKISHSPSHSEHEPANIQEVKGENLERRCSVRIEKIKLKDTKHEKESKQEKDTMSIDIDQSQTASSEKEEGDINIEALDDLNVDRFIVEVTDDSELDMSALSGMSVSESATELESTNKRPRKSTKKGQTKGC